MDRIIHKFSQIAVKNNDLNSIISCKEKVDYLLTNTHLYQKMKEEIFNELKKYHRNHLKSAFQSYHHYRRGLQYYQNKDYNLAIKSYSLAIMSAPFPSKYIGHHLLYATIARTHAFFKIENFESALFDADLALELHVTPAIIKQKVICLVKLNKAYEAMDAIESYINVAKDARVIKCLYQLRIMVRKYLYIKNEIKETIKESKHEGIDPLIHRKAFIHKDIEMKLSPTNGRYYIAKNDIPNKTYIMKEKFLISCYAKESKTYCDYCSKVLDSHFCPCEWCNEVVFCDPKCAIKSWSLYHQYECGIAGLLANMNLNAFIGYRCFTRVGCDAAINYETIYEQISAANILVSPLKNFEKQNIRFSEHILYERMMTMVDNDHKYSAEMNSYILIHAIAVTLILEYKNAFTYDRQSDKLNAFILIVMTNAKRIFVNTFGIWTYYDESDPITSHSLSGSGVAYWANYFNHSCNPNVMWNSRNGGVEFVTARDIKAGEELNITYGSVYTYETVEQRQKKMLSKYYFECRCDACKCELNALLPLKCLKCKYGVIFYDNGSTEGNCNVCSTDYQNFKSVRDFVVLTKHKLDSILNVENCSESNLLVKVAEKLIISLSPIVCEQSREVIALKRKFAKACDLMGRSDLAIIYGEEILRLRQTDEESLENGDLMFMAEACVKYLEVNSAPSSDEWQICIDWILKLIDAGNKFVNKHSDKKLSASQAIEDKQTLDSLRNYLKDKEKLVLHLINSRYSNQYCIQN